MIDDLTLYFPRRFANSTMNLENVIFILQRQVLFKFIQW